MSHTHNSPNTCAYLIADFLLYPVPETTNLISIAIQISLKKKFSPLNNLCPCLFILQDMPHFQLNMIQPEGFSIPCPTPTCTLVLPCLNWLRTWWTWIRVSSGSCTHAQNWLGCSFPPFPFCCWFFFYFISPGFLYHHSFNGRDQVVMSGNPLKSVHRQISALHFEPL